MRWFIIAALLLMPAVVFAQAVTELNVAPFGEVITDFYSISLRVVGVAVFIMFLVAGLSYILPDAIKPSFMSNPRKIILDAIIGTILLFAAYVILNTINPSLVRLQGTPRPTPAVTAPTGGGTASPSPRPVSLPACTDLQIVYDQAKEACATGETDACAVRDQIVVDAQDLCTLTP